jgi:hypothetical protein
VTTLQYVVNAIDGASATFTRIAGSAEALNEDLDKLGKKSVAARVGLEGDKEMKLSLDQLDLKMATLSKRIASPKVTVEGLARAKIGIAQVDLAMDKLGAKSVTAHIKVDVDRSRLNKLTGGLLGAAGSGGGAGAGTAALGSLASPASGSLGMLGNPYVLAGGGLAAAATAPFAATAVAGSLVTVMGGAFTAIAIMAAAKNKQVAKSFTGLKTSAVKDIKQISTPFVGVLESIARQAKTTLPLVMKPFGDAIKSIAGPFQQFATTLIRSFGSPSVARSIRDMGGAFGSLLKSLKPMLPSIINQIADGIDGIAQAIRAHPAIFADMINFLGHLVGWSLQAVGALTRVANWMVKFVRDAGHWLSQVRGFFVNMFNTVKGNAIAFRASIAAVWDTIWRNTVTRAQHGINDVIGWFKTLPGRAMSAINGLGTSLYAFGHMALTKLWNGMKNVFTSVWNWFKSLPGKLLHAIGINSPPAWAIEAGKHIMGGILHGVTSRKNELQSAFRSSVKFADTGARSGSAQLAQSFAASVLPRGWSFSDLLALWNQESGWNAYAVNASSGAYGIPQSLGHGHPYNLGDYKAQIMWGINYIAGRYGNSQGAWQHERSFNWYDRGGLLMPGVTMAVNSTGAPEQVVPNTGPGSMAEVARLLRRTNQLLEAAPGRTAAGVGDALNGTTRRVALGR